MPTEVKQYDFWLKYGELHREERVGGDYVLASDYDKLVEVCRELLEVCRELLEVEGVQGWDCESSPEPMPEKYNVAHDKLLTLIGKAKAIAIVGEKSPIVPTPWRVPH